MSKEDLAHLFEPFYTTKTSGTGLGMNIVKSIVDAHKGKITVQSQIDKGTSVEIQLPCLQKHNIVLRQDSLAIGEHINKRIKIRHNDLVPLRSPLPDFPDDRTIKVLLIGGGNYFFGIFLAQRDPVFLEIQIMIQG